MADTQPLDPNDLHPGYGPKTFDEALAAADQHLEGKQALLAAHPDDWLYAEGAARALMARFRLTASAEDLSEADRVLDRAIELAPWPAGPALSRAGVSLSMHDLDGAEQALARFDASAVPAPDDEQADANSIRCEIAFERGQLDRARQLCGSGDGVGLALRRANIAAQTGEPASGAQIVEDLMRVPRQSPSMLATLALERAAIALSVGDWDTSAKWIGASRRVFTGYWLSDAYAAQQLALDGQPEKARRAYEAIAARTDNADVYDALANLAKAGLDEAGSEHWGDRALAAWQVRSRLLPRTYAGHYAEHLLLHGDEAAALSMAREDHRRRPYPGTIVHYAYAAWLNGDAARAADILQEGEAAGFVTADMKLIEGLSLSSLGRGDDADKALAEARAINPRIADTREQFITFRQE